MNIALPNAANAVGNLKEGHLADFFLINPENRKRPTDFKVVFDNIEKAVERKP